MFSSSTIEQFPDAEAHSEALMQHGYSIIKQAASRALVKELASDLGQIFAGTPFCQGDFYGSRTKRFGRLLTRSPLSASLVMNPIALLLAQKALGPWCDTIQLNLTQAIEIHPRALQQFPHRDQDMWQGETGRIEYLINILWPLTSFTADNGATVIWPHSHGQAALGNVAETQPIVAESEPGDAIVFLGSTLHGGGENRTNSVRQGIIISYCLGWLKPYENQWLAYPPEIARTFPRELSALVGYQQHRPNLGNFEGQCPSILFEGKGDKQFAATDALRPDQTAMLADFVNDQRKKSPS